ncbi:MAG: hypothetical protein ACFFG0_25800, partial [Candidatus Thorarchaeota archaeon]
LNLDKCDQIDQDITSSDSKVREALSTYNAIAFFPHPFTENTGIAKTVVGESLQDFVKEPLTYLWNMGTPKDMSRDLISADCPKDFFPTEIRFETNPLFKNIARIKVSDAHEIGELDDIYSKCPNCDLFEYCNKGFTYLKLSTPSILALKQIGYDYKSRVLFNIENIFKYPYIIGIYIKSQFFKDRYFRFNPELNVLIGGRGVGKSLLIDLIRFVYNSIPDKEDEYYAILHDKIREQLGNGGKVILFHKNDDNYVLAIERRLVLINNKAEIDWEKDTEFLFYEKYKNKPFYPIKSIENPNSYMEALSQTEIPTIHTKTKSSLFLIDAFIEDFNEIIDRKTKLNKLDDIGGELKILYDKYNNLEKIQNNLLTKLKEQESKFEYLESLKHIDLSKYQKYIGFNERVTKFLETTKKWFSDVKHVIIEQPQIDIFSDIQNEEKKELKDIIKDFERIRKEYSNIKTKTLKIVEETELNFRNIYGAFINDWAQFYELKYDEYQKFIKNQDIDFVEKVQKEIINLNLDIESMETELKDFQSIRENIKEKEQEVINTAEEINNLTNIINRKRRNVISDIKKKLNKYDIKLKIRLKKIKKSKDYTNFLLKIHQTDLIKILNKIQNDFKPYYLGIYILKDQLENYSKNFKRNRRTIFKKLGDLTLNSDFPFIFKNLDLINLFKIYIDKRPIISYKRVSSNQYTNLDKLSIGERCAVILFIMLLEKNKPLLIDQADAELDQDSIKRFSTYLLTMKKNRQIIVATHNANIPVLGDVDLLYHLNTIPSEEKERELGIIENNSGFEDSIENLLILEGGKDAIKRRFKKYDWKIL